MPAEVTKSFGARLRRLRHERGLTQEGLGGDHYSAAYVSQLEAGHRTPSLEAVEFLASGLGVDPGFLRTGTEPDLHLRLDVEIQEARAGLYRGKPEEAETELRKLEGQARRHSLVQLRAKALEALGIARERAGDARKALELFQKTEQILAAEPAYLRAGAAVGIARCFQQLGDFRYAAHALEDYRLELKNSGLDDPTALMRVNAGLVSTYFALGMTDYAVEAAEQAKRLERRAGDPEQIACMNLNVARVLLYQEKSSEAAAALHKAEDIFSSFDWKNEVARVEIALGIVHAKQEDLAAARSSLLDALSLLEQAPNPLDEARARNELARVERLSGDVETAREHLKRVLKLVAKGDLRVRAFALRELGLCSESRSEAEKHLAQAIDLYRRAGDRNETATTFRALGDLRRKEGDVEGMADAYRQGIEAVEERGY